MDPNSTFLLKIKLLGNPKKVRKDVKCFCFEKVVDCDLINYKDFIESVVEQYPPGYLEVAHIQYYDEASKTFPEVKCDKELMSMFEKYMQRKVVDMFIAYCDPLEPYVPIFSTIVKPCKVQLTNMQYRELVLLMHPKGNKIRF